MPTKIALTVGVDRVDPSRYGVPMPFLRCGENDAYEIGAFARGRGGYNEVITLCGAAATLGAVRLEIAEAASRLQQSGGGSFLLSFSGHGSQVPDPTFFEHDGRNETWCLHDGELMDQALFATLRAFGANVNVLIISDCCHSGEEADPLSENSPVPPGLVSRSISRGVADAIYARNPSLFDRQERFRDRFDREDAIAASVLLLASCDESQLSYEGSVFGFFTDALLRAATPLTCGNYDSLRDEIDALTPDYQKPQLKDVSRAAAFRKLAPFKP